MIQVSDGHLQKIKRKLGKHKVNPNIYLPTHQVFTHRPALINLIVARTKDSAG